MKKVNSIPKASRRSFQLYYSLGQGVEALVYTSINNFLFYYLTLIVGLQTFTAGLIILSSLIIDGIANTIIGNYSDTYISPIGRRHPFMIYSIFPLAASVGLLFSLPMNLDGTSLIAYVIFLNMVMRVSLGVFVIPYGALAVELWSNYDERSLISLLRAAMSSVLSIALLMISFQCFFSGNEGISRESAYPLLGWTTSALILFFGLICWSTTLSEAKKLAYKNDQNRFSLKELANDFREMSSSPTFRKLSAGLLLSLISSGLMFNLNLYVMKFVWGMSEQVIKYSVMAFPFGFFLGLALTSFILSKVEKNTGAALSNLFLAVLLSCITGISLMSAPGNIGSSISWIAIGTFGLFGCSSTLLTVSIYSMIADAVDEHELLFGGRKEGTYYSALVLGSKLSAGIGSALAGLGLQLIGFTPELTDPFGSISSGHHTGLLAIWGLVPAATFLIAAVIFTSYHLDRQELQKIQKELSNRKHSTLL
jgi:GPH family glycoside/pentoside/hexuronide:cation symporter